MSMRRRRVPLFRRACETKAYAHDWQQEDGNDILHVFAAQEMSTLVLICCRSCATLQHLSILIVISRDGLRSATTKCNHVFVLCCAVKPAC